MRRLEACVLSLACLSFACSQDSAKSADTRATADKDKDKDKDTGAKGGEAKALDGKPMGQMLSNEVLDLNAILRKSPEEAEKILGTPKEAAQAERSCVRFVPKRVFFKCKHDTRLYEHGKVESILVDYQDGAAANVEIIGLPGAGGFSQDGALALIGLSLPGEPKHSNPPAQNDPEATVDLWSWGNDTARLVVDGHQFRVRVSTVNGEWFRAKVELLDNTQLSAEEKSRIMPVRGEESEGSSEAPAPAPGAAAPSNEAAPAPAAG